MWPGEPVAKVLEDLQSAWRWGRAPNLQAAMEMVMWALVLQKPDKVRFVCFIFWTQICVCVCDSVTVCFQDSIPQQWLMWKQEIQKTGLYINKVKILLVNGFTYVFVSFQVPSPTFLNQVSYKLDINTFSNLSLF